MSSASSGRGPPTIESTLYADVLSYQQKAASMVSSMPLAAPAIPYERGGQAGGMPIYEIGVVDAVVKKPSMLGGTLLGVAYIEYEIALTRRSDNKIVTIGKRYSELHYFNHELRRRDVIRKIDAPSFPEKKIFSSDWWTLSTTEPDGKFVKERREEIHYYLKKLIIANPTIFYDSFVQTFFELETFDQRADEQAYLNAQASSILGPAAIAAAAGSTIPLPSSSSSSHPLPPSQASSTPPPSQHQHTSASPIAHTGMMGTGYHEHQSIVLPAANQSSHCPQQQQQRHHHQSTPSSSSSSHPPPYYSNVATYGGGAGGVLGQQQHGGGEGAGYYQHSSGGVRGAWVDV